jgi:hypothetical protein
MSLTPEQQAALAEFDQRARADREDLERTQDSLNRVRREINTTILQRDILNGILGNLLQNSPNDAGAIATARASLANKEQYLASLRENAELVNQHISAISTRIASSPAERQRILEYMANRSAESTAAATDAAADPNATDEERRAATQNAIADEVQSQNTREIAESSEDNEEAVAAPAAITPGTTAIVETLPPGVVADPTSPTGYVDANGVPYQESTLDDVVVTGARSQREVDHRIRIRPRIEAEDAIYGTAASAEGAEGSGGASILEVLRATSGVIFPYTPVISYAHQANYSQMATVHANQDYYVYTNSPAIQIQITGPFTAQNEEEGRYMLAAKHFFQTITKMRFGEDDPQRGLPPPVVILSGYGDYMFNDLPVIVTNFTMELPNNVDYVEIEIDGIKTYLPAVTNFAITCVVQQTPKQQRTFDWGKFATGELMRDRKGWL